eukprot:Lithocolla_globosa_v1_NODE_255_length_4802_cov_69.795660.p3 type:complete len:319 gc:universal NODE_255_length_4802_cov_69.795660:1786-2742(+)
MYGGKEINIDQLFPDNLPGFYQRKQMVARNPLAAAKFFHKVVDAFLHCLLGISRKKNKPLSDDGGILGHVKAHYGTVEAQGRGSLHIHLLLWLLGPLSPDEIILQLQSGAFKARFLEYLEDIICEDFLEIKRYIGCTDTDWGEKAKPVEEDENGNYDLKKEMKKAQKEEKKENDKTKKDNHPCCGRAPDPDGKDFETEMKRFNIARCSQIHMHCTTCFKYVKPGEAHVCRFAFPKKYVERSYVDEEGTVHLKRENKLTNSFNLYTSVACRCNHDIKFIASNKDADYITKSALSTYQLYFNEKCCGRTRYWSVCFGSTI